MKNKQTFTLLELLVVIAIIGVLVSMLTPGLSRARELARSVKCAGNLKQIALGFNIYSLDFDDYFPSPSFEDDDGNFMSWHDMLSNYAMSSSINVFVCPSVDEDAKFNPYGRGFPGTTQIQEATYTINSMDDQTADWRVDGVNLLDGTPYSPTKSLGWTKTGSTTKPFQVTKAIKPAQSIHVVDTPDVPISGSGDISSVRGIQTMTQSDLGPISTGIGIDDFNSSSRQVGIQHNFQFNATFGDGHVESIDQSEPEQWVVWVED